MKLKTALKGAVAGVTLVSGSAAFAGGHGELNVAYFLEWPMPFQAAKVSGAYDAALGMKVNWVSFDTGTAMSAAMASGDIDISVSQGVPPFVVATSAGQDLQIVDVAVSYADNDNCVVASGLEIDKSSAGELAGKKVAVPLGTAAHYGFLKQMEHFGVSLDSADCCGHGTCRRPSGLGSRRCRHGLRLGRCAAPYERIWQRLADRCRKN